MYNTVYVSKPYRYARKLQLKKPKNEKSSVSKPYRYARKFVPVFIVWINPCLFQNLIGMLGRHHDGSGMVYGYTVSKPYRYARKRMVCDCNKDRF